MKKNNNIIRVFQVVFLLLLGMVFWSTQLINKDLKVLTSTLVALEEKVKNVCVQLSEQETNIHSGQQISALPIENSEDNLLGNPELSNILTPDPYFVEVLPKLLPKNFHPKGTYSLVTMGQPDHLHPFSIFSDVADFYSLCVPSLGILHKGKSSDFAPGLARKIEEVIPADNPDAREFHIYLRKDIFWEPLRAQAFPNTMVLSPFFMKKHPVTAHDFKFKYDAIMNPYVVEGRAIGFKAYYADIEFIHVVDDYTFIIRWKPKDTIDTDGNPIRKVIHDAKKTTLYFSPLPSFVFRYFSDGSKIIEDDIDPDIYRKHSIWAQNFSSHWARQYIVSCGPWIFNSFSRDKIILDRNPHYFDQKKALINRRIYHIKDSQESVFHDFKMGKNDVMYLPYNDQEALEKFMNSAEYLAQEAQQEAIFQKNISQRSYNYLGWNMQNKFFESKLVRQALCLAIDKEGLVRSVLNNAAEVVNGPFYSETYACDPSIKNWPFDPEEAKRLLDKAGWIDLDGDGIRDKMIDGKRVPFRFRLHYYNKGQTNKNLAETVAVAFKEIGIVCEPYGVGRTDLSMVTEDRTFDALLLGWTFGLGDPNPRPIWHSEGATQKGSLNFVGFVSQEADMLIELLSYETDRAKRTQLYYRLHKLIVEESPYTFLVKRKLPMVYREYIKNFFVPKERQDLIPGAEDDQVDDESIWIERN
ncbi:Uncharacterized protein CLAVI_000624 [Candidatus Clavichlamydia salmonicola]|uniref:ABC transporter substrate-binding protein n=1 Tax=Candidatus Clavichlamydia salmonicola TaxID=469812 RepID=UPI001891155F|nr:ABC transporter substrate-binding protein [Candidatus Clavichlamydia salmonicola]MBF5051000.1 Uncharacterized protein [Candidatus Clavichlamydia salmonicola]